MVFISIGRGCMVKYQINKHTGSSPTLFFDWLITDMDSVIEIFNSYSCGNIDSLLSPNNTIQCSINPVHNNKTSRFLIGPDSLSCCTSIHDVNIKYTAKDIFNFIEKYKRRFMRIIEYINSNEKIYFIRYDKINNDQRVKFIETIKRINAKCNFVLIAIKPDQKNSEIKIEENYKEINLTSIETKNATLIVEPDWSYSHWDWNKIFYEITKE
jgi:hypothetical protein